MTKKTKNILIGVAALIIVGLIMDALGIDTSSSSTASTPSSTSIIETAASKPAKPTKYDAYGICCQLALDRYGKGDMELVEGIDMGDNDWIIKGYTDIPGKRIFWTGEVQKNSDQTWKLKGWVD